MENPTSLLAKIEHHYPSFSAAAQTIANYLQQNPMAAVSLSVVEIAEQTQTSKATVSRFFRQLGYASHQEFKKALMKRRELGFPSLDTEQNHDEIAQELSLVKRTLTDIPEQTIDNLVDQLASAPRVIIIGYRSSFPLAMNFSQQLRQVRAHVALYPQSAQTIAENLVDLQEDDLVVLMGFRRRPRIFNELIDALSDKTTILITDPSGQIYNQSVSHLLVCHLGDHQALDSYAAPMSLISLLCNRVYKKLGAKGQERASDIADLYDVLGELS